MGLEREAKPFDLSIFWGEDEAGDGFDGEEARPSSTPILELSKTRML